jgi:hypothetical protein
MRASYDRPAEHPYIISIIFPYMIYILIFYSKAKLIKDCAAYMLMVKNHIV